MKPAGSYSDRFVWRRRTSEKDPASGQEREAFSDNGTLWGVLEEPAGRRQADYGAEQTGADATIRVRNWPALSALDRLYLPEWGELWVIDSVARGDNELVCRVRRYDSLDLG